MANQPCILRSDCPVAASLDIFGDRWTLLILRDLLLGGATQFSELAANEGIATNTLSERLQRLLDTGMAVRRRDPEDGRRWVYAPTPKSVELVPVLFEIMLWGTRHTEGALPKAMMDAANADGAEFLAHLITVATERARSGD